MTKTNLIIGLCALLLVACGAQVSHLSMNVPAQERTTAGESTLPASEEMNATVAGINSLALALYQATAHSADENFVFSPYSVAQAFSMLYAGAAGETKAEMAQVLHFLAQQTQPRVFNTLDQRLRTIGESNLIHNQGELPTTPFQLNIVNALWGQNAYPFRQTYLDLLKQDYHIDLKTIDFRQDPEKVRLLINGWVTEQTASKIQDLIPADALNAKTRLVLVNAIYFKAAWMQPFSETETREALFTRLDQSEVRAPMMHKLVRAPYVKGNHYQAILLPYLGETVDMLIIVPELATFPSIEQQLNVDFLNQLTSQAELSDVTLALPKFAVESEINIKEALQNLGIWTAFDEKLADFSGMTNGKNDLYISNAFHKSVITVDEKGTEAAAATAAVMEQSALQSAELIINHPFIYAIRERASGAILFLGRVTNPTANR